MTPTPTSTSTPLSGTVILTPSYAIPIVLVAIALPIFLFQPWVAGILALFGLFLLFQTITLRLHFTPTALEVYRGEKQIRQFPYQEWINWRIFWFNLPILLYFRETKSIHFVPILFDPKTLQACLEQRCPQVR